MKSNRLEEVLIKRLDGIESKLDNVLEVGIPQLRVDMAIVKKESSYFAAMITAVGGAIATIASVTIAKWTK